MTKIRIHGVLVPLAWGFDVPTLTEALRRQEEFAAVGIESTISIETEEKEES